MILPIDIKPSFSLYYIGGILLEELGAEPREITDLFLRCAAGKNRLTPRQIMLGLDWLYLIGGIKTEQRKGEIYVYKNA